jgi:hypothetical protein
LKGFCSPLKRESKKKKNKGAKGEYRMHYMVTKRVLVVIKGNKKRGKFWGGKGVVAIERILIATIVWRLKPFWSPQLHGDQNHFGRHQMMATRFCCHQIVTIKFNYHPTTTNKFGCHKILIMILVTINGLGPFSVTI